MVREFKLINEEGQEYSLMDIHNHCLLTEPAGLGYSYTTEYEQLGNTFITNLRRLEKGQISGVANFKNYDNFKDFIDFVENSEKLKFYYKIPYKDGTSKVYFKDIEIQSMTKTDKRTNVLSETVAFDCLSLWYEEKTITYKIESMDDEMVWDFYWDAVFNDSNSTSIPYKNEGHTEAPIILNMEGPISKPRIEVYIENILYQKVEIDINISEHEKLIYNSRENEFEITRVKTDGTKESLFKNGVIKIENDNVVRIPKNKICEIKLKADNVIDNAELKIFPQYKAV